ncbi:hypothetical protein HELRODRAFT_171817 [Helobdella robusta]|uniref:Uncharacterized protein n=1 Tax=Helobdella robusta TaxID=6412 RepID=T1F4Q7_HELRO|nr:hypothetical protein HELRODRAFT_171817 [Helobdella robusta]ESO05418.1 hypothetical protein HELRODRAFT_171817 [Helobdella robusta]
MSTMMTELSFVAMNLSRYFETDTTLGNGLCYCCHPGLQHLLRTSFDTRNDKYSTHDHNIAITNNNNSFTTNINNHISNNCVNNYNGSATSSKLNLESMMGDVVSKNLSGKPLGSVMDYELIVYKNMVQNDGEDNDDRIGEVNNPTTTADNDIEASATPNIKKFGSKYENFNQIKTVENKISDCNIHASNVANTKQYDSNNNNNNNHSISSSNNNNISNHKNVSNLKNGTTSIENTLHSNNSNINKTSTCQMVSHNSINNGVNVERETSNVGGLRDMNEDVVSNDVTGSVSAHGNVSGPNDDENDNKNDPDDDRSSSSHYSNCHKQIKCDDNINKGAVEGNVEKNECSYFQDSQTRVGRTTFGEQCLPDETEVGDEQSNSQSNVGCRVEKMCCGLRPMPCSNHNNSDLLAYTYLNHILQQQTTQQLPYKHLTSHRVNYQQHRHQQYQLQQQLNYQFQHQQQQQQHQQQHQRQQLQHKQQQQQQQQNTTSKSTGSTSFNVSRLLSIDE